MDPLIAMARIHPERDQRRAHVRPRLDRGRTVRAVMTEHVFLIPDIVALAELNELAREMEIKRTRLILD